MVRLHPQLEKDCIIFGEFTLCTLLLLNDANYPWFILVPRRENVTELHQLSTIDQQQFLKESMFLSRCLDETFRPDKLNIAALGNIVPQLHIHHIARFTTDACWPKPVWGTITATPYQKEQLEDVKKRLLNWLSEHTEQAFHQIK